MSACNGNHDGLVRRAANVRARRERSTTGIRAVLAGYRVWPDLPPGFPAFGIIDCPHCESTVAVEDEPDIDAPADRAALTNHTSHQIQGA